MMCDQVSAMEMMGMELFPVSKRDPPRWLTGRCQHTKIRCCASTSDGLLNHYRTGTTGTKKEPPQGHRFSQDFGKDKAVRPGLRLF